MWYELAITLMAVFNSIVLTTLSSSKCGELLVSRARSILYQIVSYVGFIIAAIVMFFDIKQGLPIWIFSFSLMLFEIVGKKVVRQ